MNNPNEALLLTEQGTPIGEVVIADNTSVPEVLPNEQEAKESREAAFRAQAAELANDPNADRAVAELYPGYGDAEKRKLAMTAYVVEQKTIAEAAAAAGVPERTVSMWSYNGQWDQLAKKECAARESQAKLELARIRSERRTKIVEEQLSQAKTIRDSAIQKLQDGDASVKPAAEAWAAAAKVEHTLTGLSEAGTVADVDGQPASKGGKDEKQPLVVVFQGNGLPPVRRAT